MPTLALRRDPASGAPAHAAQDAQARTLDTVLAQLRACDAPVVVALDPGAVALRMALALRGNSGRLLVLERGIADVDRTRMRLVRADLDGMCLCQAWDVDAHLARDWFRLCSGWLGNDAVTHVVHGGTAAASVRFRQQMLLAPLLAPRVSRLQLLAA